MGQDWNELREEINKGLREGRLHRNKRTGRITARKIREKKPRPPKVPYRLEGEAINETRDCGECKFRVRGDASPGWIKLRENFVGCRSWRKELLTYDGWLCVWGKYYKTIEGSRWKPVCLKLRRNRNSHPLHSSSNNS